MALGQILLELDLELSGRVTGIFGPSGSGKTSLLEVVAGLRKPQSAFVEFNEQILTDTTQRIFVPTRERRIGYVPQDLALFPHMSVKENLLYGFRPEKPHSTNISLEHIVEILEIGGLLERKIDLLSGGEKQRVAFARALLASPRLILMDEPLANLDRQLKDKMIVQLQRVRDEFTIPMLYVSHDPDEVVALCDEVVVLEKGRCVKKGRPDALFVLSDKPHYVMKK